MNTTFANTTLNTTFANVIEMTEFVSSTLSDPLSCAFIIGLAMYCSAFKERNILRHRLAALTKEYATEIFELQQVLFNKPDTSPEASPVQFQISHETLTKMNDMEAVWKDRCYEKDLVIQNLTEQIQAKEESRRRKPRKKTAYNAYMAQMIPTMKTANPDMSHNDAFALSASLWKENRETFTRVWERDQWCDK